MPTLRAATPVRDSTGGLFAVVVLNMDMGWAFERAGAFRDSTETLFIADERGDFLLHPEPGRAFAFEQGTPFRLTDAFPAHAAAILSVPPGKGTFVEFPGPRGGHVAYIAARALDPSDPNRRLLLILDEPMERALHAVGLVHRQRLLGMGGLLLLAVVLVVVMVRRLTRSLSTLARASVAIAEGDYRIALPAPAGGEVSSLVRAFRRMAAEVERREESLAELNRELERRVDERTAALARQHSLQRLILENIADGVVVTDRDGRFLLWNRKAEQIVGAGPDEVPPERWSTHFGVYRDEGGEALTAAEMPLVRAIQGQGSDNLELYLCNPHGKSGRWAQITARPLYNTVGEITGGVAVLVDVTEQKRLRQRVESHRIELARVGRLALGAGVASSAAHQLSQPITAIGNYVGAAVRLHRQGRLGEADLLDLLSRIESLARQAGEVLDRLRALIRRSPSSVPVDVNQVADSCIDFIRDRIDRQGVKVERRYGRDLPKPVGDPMELGQVLIQLMSNALEAMEQSSPQERRLTIRTGYDRETQTALIEVADSGPGVSPAAVEDLFEPWQTEKPGALGIGLYIAQSIMETRNGRIEMEPRTAGGALFRVRLPVAREAEA
jgi:PAS domain S-box-containing protein